MKCFFTFALIAVLTVACGGNGKNPAGSPAEASCETTAETSVVPSATEAVDTVGGDSVKSQALIEVENRIYDFGNVRKGHNPSHTFVLQNKGDAPLVINKVERSCTCMEVDYTRQPIQSGKSGKVDITVHTDRLDEGLFRKVLTLHTNARNTPYYLELYGMLR